MNRNLLISLITMLKSLWKQTGLGFLLAAVVLTSCAEPPSSSLPQRDIPARNLLLDAHAFPSGWTAQPCGPDCSRDEGHNHAERSFGRPAIPGSARQEIFRLADESDARAKFKIYREVDFRPLPPPDRQFAPPPGLTYRSPLADEYYLGCGVSTVPACRTIARYRNYFIYLYFDIDGGIGDGLQLAQVEQILRALDQQVAIQFNVSLTPTTSK
jgi:hypothetical protein